GMRVGHRPDATVEGAQELVHRRVTFPRALRNDGHSGEHVLDAVIELGNLRFCLSCLLPLRNITSDCVNRDGLACCVRDKFGIDFKYASYASFCEHLDLVLRALRPLEFSIQHFGECMELFRMHVAPKRLPNRLGRREAQDAFDRWVYRNDPQIQIQYRDDVIRMLDKDTMAFFAKS